MSFNLKPRVLLCAVAVALALPAVTANAGGTISFGEDKSISVGLGIRTSFTNDSAGGATGSSSRNDFALDSMRLYMNGSLNKYIKATFNTEKKADESVGVIDAIAQFEFMPEFNIWAGRMLPPSDRANLDGPYYLLAWEYPGVVSRYPSKTTGRDDGVSIWGKLMDGKVIYDIGAFEGHQVGTRVGTTPASSDDLLYAARVQVDFWSPNGAPAYYTGSTNFGGAETLSIGFATQYQADGAVSATAVGDYKAWNVDALMEKKIGSGSVTLEGAYYDYDTSGVNLAEDGNAYLLGAAYIFDQVVGWGKIQPYTRYQRFEPDTNIDTSQYDLGVNYVIDGFNAKVSGTYSKVEAATDHEKFVVGLQLQF